MTEMMSMRMKKLPLILDKDRKWREWSADNVGFRNVFRGFEFGVLSSLRSCLNLVFRICYRSFLPAGPPPGGQAGRFVLIEAPKPEFSSAKCPDSCRDWQRKVAPKGP